MKRNKLSCLFLILVLMIGTSSCSNSKTNSNESLTLNVVTMFGGGDHNSNMYEKINTNFMEIYPNISIEDNSAMSNNDWKKSVVDSFSTGNEPDVLFFFTDASAEDILKQNKLVSVKEIQAKYPEYGKDIKENALSAVAASDGNVYALPLSGYYEGLFCNVDLFEKYNLELPTTWDKFLKAVAVFHENGVIPVSVSLNEVPHYWIEHLILSQGGIQDHMLNPKDTSPDSWVEGLAYFKTLNELGAFPPEGLANTNEEANQLFQSKQAAMQLDGSWYANGLEDKDNMTIVSFPTVPGGKKQPNDLIGGFSSGFYITKKAWDDPAKRETAVQFVMMHTTSASIARYWWGAGTPAANCLAPVGMQKLLNDGMDISAAAIGSQGMDVATDARLKPEAFKELVSRVPDIASGKATSAEVMKSVVSANAD